MQIGGAQQGQNTVEGAKKSGARRIEMCQVCIESRERKGQDKRCVRQLADSGTPLLRCCCPSPVT